MTPVNLLRYVAVALLAPLMAAAVVAFFDGQWELATSLSNMILLGAVMVGCSASHPRANDGADERDRYDLRANDNHIQYGASNDNHDGPCKGIASAAVLASKVIRLVVIDRKTHLEAVLTGTSWPVWMTYIDHDGSFSQVFFPNTVNRYPDNDNTGDTQPMAG